jgi:hypothetical protein
LAQQGWCQAPAPDQVLFPAQVFKAIPTDVNKYLVSEEAKRLVDPCLDSEFKSSKDNFTNKKAARSFLLLLTRGKHTNKVSLVINFS